VLQREATNENNSLQTSSGPPWMHLGPIRASVVVRAAHSRRNFLELARKHEPNNTGVTPLY
jgi:hypothetical protein